MDEVEFKRLVKKYIAMDYSENQAKYIAYRDLAEDIPQEIIDEVKKEEDALAFYGHSLPLKAKKFVLNTYLKVPFKKDNPRKYHITEEQFQLAYDKYPGNYSAIERELLGVKNHGNTLHISIKNASWWSNEKYPRNKKEKSLTPKKKLNRGQYQMAVSIALASKIGMNVPASEDKEISDDADMLLKDINDLSSDGMSVDQIAEELNIERAIVKRALENKVKPNPKRKSNPEFDTSKDFLYHNTTRAKAANIMTNGFSARLTSSLHPTKEMYEFFYSLLSNSSKRQLDIIYSSADKTNKMIELVNEEFPHHSVFFGYHYIQYAERFRHGDNRVILIFEKDDNPSMSDELATLVFSPYGPIDADKFKVVESKMKSNPKRKLNPARKYHITEEQFQLAYDKYPGNYSAIERELLGIETGGSTLFTAVKKLPWWSEEKYPRRSVQEANRKYHVTEEQFQLAYNKYSGNYAAIERELLGVKNDGATLRDSIKNASWWSKDKYPRRTSRKYHITEEQFKLAYDKYHGNYLAIERELLGVETGGATLRGSIKNASWWSIEKYPRRTPRKYHITEEQFKPLYDNYLGNYAPIEKELLGVENHGTTLMKTVRNLSWWSKDKYPRIRKKYFKSEVPRTISEDIFKSVYDLNIGNYPAIAHQLLSPDTKQAHQSLLNILKDLPWWSERKYPDSSNYKKNKNIVNKVDEYVSNEYDDDEGIIPDESSIYSYTYGIPTEDYSVYDEYGEPIQYPSEVNFENNEYEIKIARDIVDELTYAGVPLHDAIAQSSALAFRVIFELEFRKNYEEAKKYVLRQAYASFFKKSNPELDTSEIDRDIRDLIVDLYSKEYTITEIGKRVHVNSQLVRQVLVEENVPIRAKGNQKVKKKSNPEITVNNKVVYADGKPFKEMEAEKLKENILRVGPFPTEGIIEFEPESYYIYLTDSPTVTKRLEDAVQGKSDELFPLFPYREIIKSLPKFWKMPQTRGVIGIIWYVVREDHIYISMMAARPEFKRNRIILKLLEIIKKKHGDLPVDFGGTTRTGEMVAKKFATEGGIRVRKNPDGKKKSYGLRRKHGTIDEVGEDIKEIIVNLYKDGETLEGVARRVHLNIALVKEVLKQKNVSIKKGGTKDKVKSNPSIPKFKNVEEFKYYMAKNIYLCDLTLVGTAQELNDILSEKSKKEVYDSFIEREKHADYTVTGEVDFDYEGVIGVDVNPSLKLLRVIICFRPGNMSKFIQGKDMTQYLRYIIDNSYLKQNPRHKEKA